MMNFVIYSYNFFPYADAESYCATRFASALARAGHSVTVVTMDWPMQVSQDSYDALVAKELKIVKVPFSDKKNTPMKALIMYGHKSQAAVDVSSSVKAVKNVLKSMHQPILITRCHPVASCMVGLNTYKYAYRWIAHFSDPTPWLGTYANSIGHRLLKQMEISIVRKTLKKASGISVTCKQACRFFKELYGNSFNENNVVINTHIGDYRLGKHEYSAESDSVPILLHTGTIMANRGGRVIKKIMESFLEEDFPCKFIQVGAVDSAIADELVNSDNIEILNTVSLEKSLELCRKSKVNFVPDVETSDNYSPVLPSKFVYRVMDTQPIVVYSKKDSPIYDYVKSYPNSGVFWAEEGDISSLSSAIKDAINCKIDDFNRTKLRECFSEQKIVNDFISYLEKMINHNQLIINKLFSH